MTDPSRPDPSQLVLGLADRMPPRAIEPFVLSLRRTGYEGQVGLVVGNYGAADLAAIRGMVDLVWPVDDQYGAGGVTALAGQLRKLRTTRMLHRAYPAAFAAACALGPERFATDRWRRLEFRLEGLVALRWVHFYDVVRELEGAEKILLTDVRDVLFQLDPFSTPVAGLELFAEEPPATIYSEPHNRRWIREQYGRRALTRFADEPVSCCGTVVGDRASILHYLSEMRFEICTKRLPLSGDQGIHNFLIHSGRLKPGRLVANGLGRVITVGSMTAVTCDAEGYVRNHDGTRPAVVHQYDRHAGLVAELVPLLTGDVDDETAVW